MKTIDTLIEDVNDVLKNTEGSVVGVDALTKLGSNIALKVQASLTREKKVRPPKVLYMSEIGKPCLRQIWYGYHMPEAAEPLSANARLKFLYGDILEEVLLFLAKQAGHTVTLEQERCEIHTWRGWTVVGRLDAVIDGVLVDVKSTSPYGFKKFEEGLTDKNDSFGYRAQLDAYSRTRSGLKKTGWFYVDKQNGKLGFATHRDGGVELAKADMSVGARLAELIPVLEHPDPPLRRFLAEPEGKSGNEKLCVECSYCPYKRKCWDSANMGRGLRAFAYAGKPVFLVTVVKEPKVPEINLDAIDEDAIA